MLNYMTISAILAINAHDLNNEAVSGNVTDIRMIKMVDMEGRPLEVPAVSGRMLKHWHLEHARSIELKESPPLLCEACKQGEPMRRPSSEEEGVKGCILCDMHGYMNVDITPTERRLSRVLFSWMLPVLEKEVSLKQVIHNRVSSDPQEMMPFYKSYASGMYAFVSGVDLYRLGYSDLNIKYHIAQDERIRRAIIALRAFTPLLDGAMGASLSHAIPHVKPLSMVVAVSRGSVPLPFPVSPIYPEAYTTYKGILKGIPDVALIGYNIPELQGVTEPPYTDCTEIGEVFTQVESMLRKE